MGDTPSKYDEPLQPQPQPLWAVDSRFCIPDREVTLKLKEKLFSFSGDDFEIKDAATNQPWFRMQGKAFSLREKKTLTDINGVPVLNMKETFAAFESNYKIYAGNDSSQELFKVVAHITFGKAKMHTQIVNRQNNQPLLITLKGNILTHEAVIYIGEAKQGGIPIAKIHRPYTGREYFSGQQEYYLTIAPNVDVSMLVAMVVALDEMKKD